MIGGIDIQLPTRCGESSMEVAVRAIRQYWPCAEFENGITGDRYRQFREIPFVDISEIFVYRDRSSADQWDKDGAVPELANTMIHLLADDGLITAVVDQRDVLIGEIIAAIASAIGDEILFTPAELAAA